MNSFLFYTCTSVILLNIIISQLLLWICYRNCHKLYPHITTIIKQFLGVQVLKNFDYLKMSTIIRSYYFQLSIIMLAFIPFATCLGCCIVLGIYAKNRIIMPIYSEILGYIDQSTLIMTYPNLQILAKTNLDSIYPDNYLFTCGQVANTINHKCTYNKCLGVKITDDQVKRLIRGINQDTDLINHQSICYLDNQRFNDKSMVILLPCGHFANQLSAELWLKNNNCCFYCKTCLGNIKFEEASLNLLNAIKSYPLVQHSALTIDDVD